MSHRDTPRQTHFMATPEYRSVDPVTHVSELLEEARQRNERRLVVIAGDDAAVTTQAEQILAGIDIPITETIALTDRDDFVCERLDHTASHAVMGTTRTAVILDLRDSTSPNVIGRSIGAIDGGGIGLLLVPPLGDWPRRPDDFEEGLIVEPFTREDVGSRFRERLIHTLETHEGIALIDADTNCVDQSGCIETGESAINESTASPPDDTRFPAPYYDRCLSQDQQSVLQQFEQLGESPVAIVVSAERGRGKSSAAGLAAAALAEAGWSIGITAPERSNVRALLDRVTDVHGEHAFDQTDRLSLPAGGSIEYVEPTDAISAVERETFDILFVDEAAGVAVHTLEQLLVCPRIAFSTTRHGYEGAGHGFSVKFRSMLAALDRPVIEARMQTPIRYAHNDPIERWLNHVLLLDATPAVDAAVADVTPGTTSFQIIRPEEFATNEARFREVMGLLATAHYRTEPDDIARILDAPNLVVVGLEYDDRIVAVALLAREGNLAQDRVEAAYRGERLRGNLLPDIFCSVWRDETLAQLAGLRIVRIATHPAVRRRGLGTKLLRAIRDEFANNISWLGTGFGATPAILDFWIANEFVPLSISARRNRTSGAYSAILLDQQLCNDYQQSKLIELLPIRLRDSLSDVHRTVDPAVIARLLEAAPSSPNLSLTASQWRHLTAAAGGPGRYELDPGPARDLVLTALIEGKVPLPDETKELLIAKVLQGQTWSSVTKDGDFQTISQTRRAVGDALARIVDIYGPSVVQNERNRLEGNL